ncbi:hypothetical protein BLOT_012103 [Blomia tropicalis]|nr:hypothetical protein BLOT_012103 [Blomia tropicalis]
MNGGDVCLMGVTSNMSMRCKTRMDRPQSDLFASIQWHTPIKAIVLCKEGKGQKGTDGCLLGDL